MDCLEGGDLKPSAFSAVLSDEDSVRCVKGSWQQDSPRLGLFIHTLSTQRLNCSQDMAPGQSPAIYSLSADPEEQGISEASSTQA